LFLSHHRDWRAMRGARPIAGRTSVACGGRAALGGILLSIAFQAAPEPASTPPQSALPQVTVEAQREALAPRVRTFVSESLYLENGEAATRWNSPVCPAVIGLPHEEAEFVLARLSQIAQAADVPLAAERCKPANLQVIVTTEPAALLNKWWNTPHQRVFIDESTPTTIKAFINTPRPVRVWYNSVPSPANGSSEGQDKAGQPGSFEIRAPEFANPQGDTRIARMMQWNLTSVIVVADASRLHDVKIGQLADYIGLCAFARLRTDAHRGDAPTILDLFQDAPAQSPAGLTPWDEAFLDALYHTNPTLVLQRGLMVSRMVSHIVPEAAP